MKRNLLLSAALPMALVCGPLLGQDVFELHGYMRAGVGRSSNGGEMASFYLPGCVNSPSGGPGYRLGNEEDNYIEQAMDVRAYEKLMKTLIVGTQRLTHMPWANEMQLVTRKDGQRWMRYVEWTEFTLHEEATRPVGTGAGS